MGLKRSSASTLRKPLPEILLAAGAVVAFALVLVGLELLRRRIDPRYLDRQGPTVYSEAYGWKPRPRFASLLHDVPTTVNAQAYRGREHAFAKPPERTRVVMLGDSIAFGARVADGQTFPTIGHHFASEEIEALLAEAPPRAHRVACRDDPR